MQEKHKIGHSLLYFCGGWVVGELESNAKHSFQLLGQRNVGQQISRLQKFGSKKFGQNQVSNCWDIADIKFWVVGGVQSHFGMNSRLAI